MRVSVLVVLSIWMLISPVRSATIECAHPLDAYGGKCHFGGIWGRIAPGDYEAFKQFVAENHPSLKAIRLVSPGGSVRDGILIGRLVRKHLLQTWTTWSIDEAGNLPHAPIEELCASTCALIWFGGVERDGMV